MAQYNKFWVAAIMSVIMLAAQYGLVPETWANEGTITTVVSLVAPAMVWLIPNKQV